MIRKFIATLCGLASVFFAGSVSATTVTYHETFNARGYIDVSFVAQDVDGDGRILYNFSSVDTISSFSAKALVRNAYASYDSTTGELRGYRDAYMSHRSGNLMSLTYDLNTGHLRFWSLNGSENLSFNLVDGMFRAEIDALYSFPQSRNESFVLIGTVPLPANGLLLISALSLFAFARRAAASNPGALQG